MLIIIKGERRRMALKAAAALVSVCLVIFIGTYICSLDVSYGDIQCGGTGSASIIVDGGRAGYVIVGVICFLLGVFMTFLMHKLHDINKKGDK